MLKKEINLFIYINAAKLIELIKTWNIYLLTRRDTPIRLIIKYKNTTINLIWVTSDLIVKGLKKWR